MSELVIKNLHVNVEGTEILKGVNLTIKSGEVHAVMGPNGTGKSTLAYALMGHPKYKITAGEATLDGETLLNLDPNERSKLGLFLAFQYPVAVPGVSVAISYGRLSMPIVRCKILMTKAFRFLSSENC